MTFSEFIQLHNNSNDMILNYHSKVSEITAVKKWFSEIKEKFAQLQGT